MSETPDAFGAMSSVDIDVSLLDTLAGYQYDSENTSSQRRRKFTGRSKKIWTVCLLALTLVLVLSITLGGGGTSSAATLSNNLQDNGMNKESGELSETVEVSPDTDVVEKEEEEQVENEAEEQVENEAEEQGQKGEEDDYVEGSLPDCPNDGHNLNGMDSACRCGSTTIKCSISNNQQCCTPKMECGIRMKGECIPAGDMCNSFCEMNQEEYHALDEAQVDDETDGTKDYDGEKDELDIGNEDSGKNYGDQDNFARFGADLK